MSRTRLLFTAPIVLAILIGGMFAIRSRGDDKPTVDTRDQRDCSPVARADAAATRPGEAVSIDPLANDTDADGDPLVFQIGTTTGGTAVVDDADTPTDAADDRISFTPADPAPDKAVIEYQAVDPEGVVGESIISVYVNAEGVLPAGVQSDPVTEQRAVGDDSQRCGGVPGPTSTTDPNALLDSTTTTPTTFEVTDTTVRRSTTAKKPTTTPRRTTTTRPTTATTNAPTPTTHAPSPTTTAKPTTTTTPPSTTTPTSSPCKQPAAGAPDSEWDAYRACLRQHSQP